MDVIPLKPESKARPVPTSPRAAGLPRRASRLSYVHTREVGALRSGLTGSYGAGGFWSLSVQSAQQALSGRAAASTDREQCAPGEIEADPAGSSPAIIFDVDGVLLSSPHERAWREALAGFADPDRFTTAFYQAHVAGKPRLDGARATLEELGVKGAKRRATEYAEVKQKRLEALMRDGCITAFPDAMRFVQAMRSIGAPMAAASASKNANQMMQPMQLDTGQPLLDAFNVNICGRDFRHGKPDPEIYLTAAEELGASPPHCIVIEDAPVGIEAARAGGITALGIARFGDGDLLQKAGADLVVVSLDEIAIDALREGWLCRHPA